MTLEYRELLLFNSREVKGIYRQTALYELDLLRQSLTSLAHLGLWQNCTGTFDGLPYPYSLCSIIAVASFLNAVTRSR